MDHVCWWKTVNRGGNDLGSSSGLSKLGRAIISPVFPKRTSNTMCTCIYIYIYICMYTCVYIYIYATLLLRIYCFRVLESQMQQTYGFLCIGDEGDKQHRFSITRHKTWSECDWLNTPELACSIYTRRSKQD